MTRTYYAEQGASKNQGDMEVTDKKSDDTGSINCVMEARGTNSAYNDGGGKTFTIRARELRRALTDAEQRVHEIMAEIREQEQKRDNAARLAGALQEKLDQLNQEREARTAHVRALEALTQADI
jgi:hypothetical protein